MIETTLSFAAHYALRNKLEKYISYLALYLELITLLVDFLLLFHLKENDIKNEKLTNQILKNIDIARCIVLPLHM